MPGPVILGVAAAGILFALLGGVELLGLVLLGRVPVSHEGVWSAMAATLAATLFVSFNRAQAMKVRPSDRLRSMYPSKVIWTFPLLVAVANGFIWSEEGVLSAVQHAGLAAAGLGILVCLPVASYFQLEHAESHAVFQRRSFYVIEGRASDNEWRTIAEIDDDVLELGRVQDAAFEDPRWTELRLTVEERKRRVVMRERRGGIWEHVDLLSDGNVDAPRGNAA